MACWLEPHWVSTVVAAADRGRPAVSHAVRAMLNALLADLADAAADDLADLGRIDARRARSAPSARWPAARPGGRWTGRRRGARSGCGRPRRSRRWSCPERTAGPAAASSLPGAGRVAALLYRDRTVTDFVPLLPAARHARPSSGVALVPRARQPRLGRRGAARRGRRRRRPAAVPRDARHRRRAGPSTSAPIAPAADDGAVQRPAAALGPPARGRSGRSPGGPCSSSSGRARTGSAVAAARRPAPAPGERAMRCPSCGLLAFPRLAPAIITLVTGATRRCWRAA